MVRYQTLAALVACVTPALPQTLALSSAISDNGKPSITISINTGERSTVALEFEIRLPMQRLAAEASIAPGAAAKASGKSLNCGGRWIKAPRTYAYTCIIAGGRQAIASGPIVEIQLEPARNAKRGSYKISIERIVAIDSDGNHRSLKSADVAVAALH
jgi:hypothetical protein